jgi:hypothetical protein
MTSPRLSNTAHSTAFELLAESHFLSELLQEMWFQRDQLIDVLHSQVDAFGYDLVLTTANVTRHVQLKTRKGTARTARLNLSARLETLPSACVILMDWTPPTAHSEFNIEYRWFGSAPGKRIPALGEQNAKHTKANAHGIKAERPEVRSVSISGNFAVTPSISVLATRLFGAA